MNTFYILLPIFVALIGLIECNSQANATDAKIDPRYASYCYYCSSCPVPFYASSYAVSTVSSPTGWCMKRSYSSQPGAQASRGAAPQGSCLYNGCQWRLNEFVCCCDSYKCNTASAKSYSIISVIGTALLMFFRH